MNGMKKIKLLVLEDDIRTLRFILAVLDELGEHKGIDIAVTILSDYIQVQEYINKNPQIIYDILLLDRDCSLGGSFHVLELERLGPEKVIAISSVPKYNEEAKKRGVRRVVLKDYGNLDAFAESLAREVEDLLRSLPMREDNIVHPI